MSTENKMMASDPLTGLHLRLATREETAVYLGQPVMHASFRKAVRVGDVLVDQYNGPGAWFGGAGF